MGKKGVAQISGVVKPIVGEIYTYNVTGWYPDTEPEKRNPNNVTWELFKQRSLGKFTTTNIRKKGISNFTFGEKAVGSVYKLQAYLYEPEGGGLIITPQPAKIPKIDKVELFYVDDKKGSTFSFMEKLRARAYCVNMLKKELVFTLWEDDAKGEGHNANNKLIETRKAKVNENGIAVTEFMLTKALMKKAMQGETDPKQLEFYVTVEYYLHKKHATDNVNINNPLPPIKHEVPVKPRGVPKAKGSPAASKPASKKEERGILENVRDWWKDFDLWDWGESSGTIKKDKPPIVQKPDGKSPAIVKEQPKQTKEENCKCCRIDEEIFFANYEKEFPRRNKKGNLLPMRESLKESLRKVFRGIRQYYSKEERDCDIRKIAYMLATARHETAHTFNPIKEYGGKRYLEGMYDPILGKNEKRRKMALENENTQQGDGVKYCGRGFVQVTWKKNYRKMGEKFGVDLVQFPEKALEHDLAIKIMIYGSEEGTFTGRALGDYINEKETDYYNARRVINGIDKASTIQGYSEKIEKCLKIKKCRD